MDEDAGHGSGHAGKARRLALRESAPDEQRHVRPRRDCNDEGRNSKLKDRGKVRDEVHGWLPVGAERNLAPCLPLWNWILTLGQSFFRILLLTTSPSEVQHLDEPWADPLKE